MNDKDEDVVGTHLKQIILRDLQFAIRECISEKMMEDANVEVIYDRIRKLVQLYIKGVFRAEVLQETSSTCVIETLPFPASIWECIKFHLNSKLHMNFKVKTMTLKKTVKMEFTRNAMYPHLPSIRKEYGAGRCVMKEYIHTTVEDALSNRPRVWVDGKEF